MWAVLLDASGQPCGGGAPRGTARRAAVQLSAAESFSDGILPRSCGAGWRKPPFHLTHSKPTAHRQTSWRTTMNTKQTGLKLLDQGITLIKEHSWRTKSCGRRVGLAKLQIQRRHRPASRERGARATGASGVGSMQGELAGDSTAAVCELCHRRVATTTDVPDVTGCQAPPSCPSRTLILTDFHAHQSVHLRNQVVAKNPGSEAQRWLCCGERMRRAAASACQQAAGGGRRIAAALELVLRHTHVRRTQR